LQKIVAILIYPRHFEVLEQKSSIKVVLLVKKNSKTGKKIRRHLGFSRHFDFLCLPTFYLFFPSYLKNFSKYYLLLLRQTSLHMAIR
jgi:hypothetical protein